VLEAGTLLQLSGTFPVLPGHERSMRVDVVETRVGRGRVIAGMIVTNLSFRSCYTRVVPVIRVRVNVGKLFYTG
jgi:hypothetical protein